MPLFKDTFDWAVDKFKDYRVTPYYDNKVNFGNVIIKVGTDEIRLFGCNELVTGKINNRKIKDVKKELRELK